MYFPKALRDAIPDWENSARMLNLTGIDRNCSHTEAGGGEALSIADLRQEVEAELLSEKRTAHPPPR
jgi:hypothetical protein